MALTGAQGGGHGGASRVKMCREHRFESHTVCKSYRSLGSVILRNLEEFHDLISSSLTIPISLGHMMALTGAQGDAHGGAKPLSNAPCLGHTLHGMRSNLMAISSFG